MAPGSLGPMVVRANLPESSGMTEEELLGIFERSGAVLLDDHFKLRSGWHSPVFIQYSLVAQDPKDTDRIAQQLASPFQKNKPDAVLGPVTIGMLLAESVARHLGVRVVFAAAGQDGKFVGLRSGFRLFRGERVLIVNDLTTTGNGVQQLAAIVKDADATVAGIALVASRTPEVLDELKRTVTPNVHVLLELSVEQYVDPSGCPLCQQGIPIKETTDYR